MCGTAKVKEKRMHSDEKEKGAQKEFRSTLDRLRDSLHSAAERPDAFWARQHSAIMGKIEGTSKKPATGRQPVWALLVAGVILLLCLTQFPERDETYVLSFAAGDDQELLLEVERALNRPYPEALAPARHLSREMENAAIRFEKTP
jgi:hypothetical protein